jgi:cellulose synthase/poly-beta-1,6-N-acetylglucosamine synthase-like glycosyltransferase
VKRLETALGSMVGGDGAIYAIRRSLWRELPADAINDFLNPLQIVASGHRAVYEPDAVCYEDTAGSTRSEYRRRVRIVSRSWRAVFQAREVLNPFRHGLFTWSVVSHKVLRWFSGLLAVLALAGATPWLLSTGRVGVPMWAVILGGAAVLAMTAPGRRTLSMLWYFAIVNVASLVGIARGTLGRVSGVWTPPRVREVPGTPRLVPVGSLVLAAVVLVVLSGVSAVMLGAGDRLLALLFWGPLAVLGYVYAGYPALLAVLRAVRRRPVQRDAIEPTVCLFIAANDEAGVIEAKLRNALALDYPPERLDIVVASDGSIDGTNAIVRRFVPRVRLLEYAPRRGKVAVIKDGLAAVASEIVVFSDANTFLEPGAVRALVQNFADEAVGAVSGDVTLVGERAALAGSEDLYYRYERWIQWAESEIGSMIGADGALYGIRRALFVPPAGDIILDDLVIPMAVIRQGHRVVFESGARAREQGSESAWEEFSRKSRVTAGAVQFLKRADSAVPISTPQVVVSLLSHKALRWLSPAFAACAFLASIALADASRGYALAAIGQGALCLAGLAGCVPSLRRPTPIAMAHYFCLVQAAAAVGLWRGLVGRQSVLWERFVRVQVSR